MTRHPFTLKVIGCIRAIPEGRVAIYGQIAALAGNPRGARQVARVLHSCSRDEELPWHRVINREGRISLGRFQGQDEQQRLLEQEGVECDISGCIDLERYQWLPAR